MRNYLRGFHEIGVSPIHPNFFGNLPMTWEITAISLDELPMYSPCCRRIMACVQGPGPPVPKPRTGRWAVWSGESTMKKNGGSKGNILMDSMNKK